VRLQTSGIVAGAAMLVLAGAAAGWALRGPPRPDPALEARAAALEDSLSAYRVREAEQSRADSTRAAAEAEQVRRSASYRQEMAVLGTAVARLGDSIAVLLADTTVPRSVITPVLAALRRARERAEQALAAGGLSDV